MSNKEASRRADVKVVFDGCDITKDIMPYFLSLTYTDNEEDECDNLSVELEDREGIWLESWAAEMIEAAAASRKIRAEITRKNWTGKGEDEALDCGEFELDSVTVSGPPSTLSLDAASLPWAEPVRQTVKYKEWEDYYLSGIAAEVAKEAGLGIQWLSGEDPHFEREEQFGKSDIVFLSELCHENGLSLKVTDGKIVVFDQPAFEAAAPVRTIRRGDRSYTSYSLDTGEAETQYSACHVSYVHPEKGLIEATFENPDAKGSKNGQVLQKLKQVNSAADAETAAKSFLRLANKFEMTASFAMPGDPSLCAGMTVKLEGFGAWDGKYMIRQASHTVSGKGGYTTSIKLRMVLNGY